MPQRSASKIGRASRSKIVSPDTDSAKVTMQTRVAVRDKLPHRFQVIPLREIMKLPSQSEQPAELRLFKSSQQSSSRSRKFSVHVDESGNDKRTQSLGRTSGNLVLQNKDTNRRTPESRQKKSTSLEVPVDLDREPTQTIQPSLALETFSPSRGYSQSLNQYSFRLKPWKSSTQSQASARMGVRQPGSTSPIPGQSDDPYDWGSPASDQHSSGFSTTLNDSDTRVDLTLHTLPSNESKKRHAIYSHMGILPLEEPDFLSDSEAEHHSLPFDAATFSSGETMFLATASEGLPDLPSSAGRISLTPVLPLKLVRTSMVRPKPRSADDVLYSAVVLQLMRELDNAIESWN